METGQLSTIEQWHEAVNSGDAKRAGELCTADVEVSGRRGSGFGRELVVEWVGHAGIQVEPVRWFCGGASERGERTVVEQEARWHDGAGGHTAPVRQAMAFRTNDGLICGLSRHPSAAEALEALGLAAGDEVLARA